MRKPDHSTAQRSEAGTLPRPWLAVALLAAAAGVCVSLGFWQFGRAEESRAARERFEAALALPPARLRTADEAGDALRYRKVELTGRYVPERQVLIDNIVHRGTAGYYVLTPFEPADGGPWLLVNRGWVPADPVRTTLPDVSVDGVARRVVGVLDRLPAPGLRLDDMPVTDGALVVVSFPTIDMLEDLFGRSLFEYQLRLDPEESDGFEREIAPPGLPPERHLGYAAQWWLFAAIAGGAALVIAARTMRRRGK